MSTDAWKGLVTADATIAAADGILNGWVITPTAKAALLSAVDNQNRPLFISNVQTDNGVPTLLGSPVSVSKNLVNVDSTGQLWGFAGDWTNAIYGVVQDLNVSVSEEATLQSNGETLPLWQHNMFAVRVEFEVGFIVKDPACFVKLVA